MRVFAIGAMVVFLGFSQAWAQSGRPAEAEAGTEIEAVIGAQIDAFLEDDFTRAFSFASPTIRSLFGSPENFGAMVRGGYPMVWRPKDISFLELRDVSGNLWQRIAVRDNRGVAHYLDYQMVRIGELWKINGVQLLRPPGTGV